MLEINNKKKKNPQICVVETVCYSTTNGHWRSQTRNLKMPGDKWKWKYNDLASMGHSQSNSKREVYNDICLPQETRKTFGQTHQENKGEGPNK